MGVVLSMVVKAVTVYPKLSWIYSKHVQQSFVYIFNNWRVIICNYRWPYIMPLAVVVVLLDVHHPHH